MTTQAPQQITPNRSTKGQRCSVDVPGLGLVDGRTREARLYGQAVADITQDLGGEDVLSRAQLELARRAAGLSVLAAMAEARLLNGENVDVTELVAVGNAQRRILATLAPGLERRDKPATPTVDEWVKQRQQE